jgi:TetR/AcrR family transcriptional regulator, transcriptional repressor for nem operon
MSPVYRHRWYIYTKNVARPLEFNRQAAIAQAMSLFLAKGYEATSIDDLTRALGISRASLYNTFGDKRGLLMQSFCCAESEGDQLRSHALHTEGNLKDVLQKFFENLINIHLDGRPARGCFFLTIGAELAATDDEVRQRVQAALKASQTLFETLLLRDGRPPEQAATLSVSLLGTMVSILALVRVFPDRALLQTLITNGLKILD